MIREFKITTINGCIYLYPVPVMKEKKYLIRCESVEQAHVLMQEMANQKIPHPDKQNDKFKVIGLHTDQQTQILEKVI